MAKKDKDVIVSGSSLQNDESYKALLQELKSIIAKGHYEAYKTVDNIKVQTYWQIGERIVREELQNKDRANYGKYLIDNLSIDLEISKRRLYEIVKFYRVYTIVRSVTAQLSWTHYVTLIAIDDIDKRSFYERKAILNSWSVRELKLQIQSQLYENTPKEEREESLTAKLPTVQPQEIFKDTYDFDFIELKNGESEKELEDKLIQDVESFLKELGQDFCICGRQVPIKIDGETHYIDLVLFHKGIPSTVLVDLKIGKMESKYVGQLNKYINYYRQNRQYHYEKDAIGLIICRKAGKDEVKYALGGLEEKIFISTYKTKLPSEKKIKSVIKKIK